MAFKEALTIARKKDVDFILLGGDLFHVNRPSSSVEHKCIKILRQHLNAKNAQSHHRFKRVSGTFSHFSKVNHANFEDPNLNVCYPILTIHGNHDDPTGPNAQSVCEKLATSGLLNYFGAVRLNSNTVCKIAPIILQKGDIKIALYGIGFIPDIKLKVALENGDVVFVEPPPDTYNILVVHQNRIPHLKDRYIPDDIFPGFVHLLIRGHEHLTEEPQKWSGSDVDGLVYQPGSTVATSISTMEAKPKKVGLFELSIANARGDAKSRHTINFEMIPLTCCRQMIMKDITRKNVMKYIKSKTDAKKLTPADFRQLSQEFVVNTIDELIKEDRAHRILQSKSQDTCDKISRFELPLVRVRLEYTSKNERFDETEISNLFYPNKIANKDIILFKKQKLADVSGESITFTDLDADLEDDFDEFEHIDLEEKRDTIDTMIENYFKDKTEDKQLEALSIDEYTCAVRGSGEDMNVISKVLRAKRDLVLKKYSTAIRQAGDGIRDFHDVEFVHDWIVNAFKTTAAPKPSSVASKVQGDIEMLLS